MPHRLEADHFSYYSHYRSILQCGDVPSPYVLEFPFVEAAARKKWSLETTRGDNDYPRHRRSLRLKSFDYCNLGAYFVTVCPKGQVQVLEKLVDRQIRPNAAGQMARGASGHVLRINRALRSTYT